MIMQKQSNEYFDKQNFLFIKIKIILYYSINIIYMTNNINSSNNLHLSPYLRYISLFT